MKKISLVFGVLALLSACGRSNSPQEARWSTGPEDRFSQTNAKEKQKAINADLRKAAQDIYRPNMRLGDLRTAVQQANSPLIVAHVRDLAHRGFNVTAETRRTVTAVAVTINDDTSPVIVVQFFENATATTPYLRSTIQIIVDERGRVEDIVTVASRPPR